MAQRNSGYARQRGDEYETPAWVTRVVVPYLRQHCSHVWDPANGPASKIASVLLQEGLDATATKNNFLLQTSLPDNRIDGVCTNPPYGVGGRLACEFIVHALALAPIVVMLLIIDFDSGKTRTHLFGGCAAFDRKIVLLDRIVWFEREGASCPSENHAWFIWNRAHRGQPTIAYSRRPR
jgi:hypothetical protein